MYHTQNQTVEKARIDFLTEHQADDISHSGRNLLVHLQGTHDILKRWGLPEHVCLAGMYHSVYGTDGFKKQPVPVSKRDQVRNLIGVEAEHLVYLFCTIRRITLFDPSGLPGIRFRDPLNTCDISQDDFSALLHLEYANTLEQCGELGFLGQFVENKVGCKWRKLKHLLSDSCNTELANTFANVGNAKLKFLMFEPVFWFMRKLNA